MDMAYICTMSVRTRSIRFEFRGRRTFGVVSSRVLFKCFLNNNRNERGPNTSHDVAVNLSPASSRLVVVLCLAKASSTRKWISVDVVISRKAWNCDDSRFASHLTTVFFSHLKMDVVVTTKSIRPYGGIHVLYTVTCVYLKSVMCSI